MEGSTARLKLPKTHHIQTKRSQYVSAAVSIFEHFRKDPGSRDVREKLQDLLFIMPPLVLDR